MYTLQLKQNHQITYKSVTNLVTPIFAGVQEYVILNSRALGSLDSMKGDKSSIQRNLVTSKGFMLQNSTGISQRARTVTNYRRGK
jgi:hypothetical protein